MPTQEPGKGQGEIHAEFNDERFAQYYDRIADTFIDTRGAAASFKKLVPSTSSVFEIGMGTGYFAHFLLEDGYTVVGSQFDDPMYGVLKRDHPTLQVVSHQRIEDYEFDRAYDAIVSHSSIFLFTRPDEAEAQALGTNLIFQSFNDNEQVSREAFDKVMGALAPNGALYINIQPNAHRSAAFAEGMNFEMYSCDYDFDHHRVVKRFGYNIDGEDKPLPEPDISYVQKWDEFQASMSERGYIAEVSEDGYWVIVRNKEAAEIKTEAETAWMDQYESGFAGFVISPTGQRGYLDLEILKSIHGGEVIETVKKWHPLGEGQNEEELITVLNTIKYAKKSGSYNIRYLEYLEERLLELELPRQDKQEDQDLRLFSEMVPSSRRRRNLELNGIHYAVLVVGGFGAYIGINSIFEAIDGPDKGKRYWGDLGQGIKIKKPAP